MKRINSSLLIVAASAVFWFFISFFPAGVYAAEHLVPSEFATIQAAISAPTFSSGDSVVVAPGTYFGPITVPNNINITIRGTETARTFLSGNSGLPVVTIDGTGATVPSIVNIHNFTFVNASSGISIANNTTLLNLSNVITVNVTNNVFQDLAGTAITESASRATTVSNNTFNHNVTALSCDYDIGISNNIFSLNNTAVNDTWASITLITNNAFFGNSQDVVSGTTVTTGTLPVLRTTQNPTPLFVDPVNHDFHLEEGSLCIGTGSNNGTPTDIGAYGGSAADTIPFPIMSQGNLPGLTITSTTDTSIGLTWLPNKSSLVTNTTPTLAGGYNLYVGPASGSYTGALTSSGTISSPINVKDVVLNPSLYPSINCTSTTSCTLTGLTPPTTPAAPDQVLSSPRDSALALTWSAVPGATGYLVFYGISSPTENGPFDTGSTATSYELRGLTNGITYKVGVKAYARQQYFFNVTAYDNQFVKGSATAPLHESAYLATNETFTQIGQPLFSELTTTTDFPEALTTYPALPNTGGRCFIATAAFGYYSAPEVQALRAFRDRYLLAVAPGRAFVEWYYRHGPAAAAFLNDHPGYKPMVRAALMPAVGAAIFMTRTSMLLKIIMFLTIGAAIAFGFYRKRLSGTGGLR